MIKNDEVLEWLKKVSREYYVVICIGGGEQINAAFIEKGFQIRFGPMGRITETLAEKQLARDVLEQNQAYIQDMIDENEISARVVIPVQDISSVLCHINGDIMLLAVYNGFDKLYELTTKDRVEKKINWLKQVAECFASIETGDMGKIEILGF